MKKGTVLLLSAIALFAAAGAALAIDEGRARPVLTLNGEPEITVEAGSYLEDEGVSATVSGLFGRYRRKKLDIRCEGTVDPKKPGDYQQSYTAVYRKKETTVSRTVHVVDTQGPVITLTESGRLVNPLLGYQEEGYRAIDTVDGDLTDAVECVFEDGLIRYTVSDSCGNQTVVCRTIEYCDWRPEIVLTDGDIELPAFENFTEPGFTAFDVCGNDLSEFITVSGTHIPSYKTGVYSVSYSILGPDGEESYSVSRRVTVVPVRVPAEQKPSGKVIYLTFDDGPSPFTGQLLDVLAKYNVKATFFVTGNRPAYREMIGRAYREGHAIGVHTYSHNLPKIYASTEAFMDDLGKAEEVVFEQTGHYTRLMRFAGGSSCIRFYNTDLIVSLLRTVTEAGYKYFDWNVSSGDGAIHTTEETVRYVKNGVGSKTLCVVLQHDTKDFSVAAVEEIIQWALANGYRFETLDVSCWGSQQRSF